MTIPHSAHSAHSAHSLETNWTTQGSEIQDIKDLDKAQSAVEIVRRLGISNKNKLYSKLAEKIISIISTIDKCKTPIKLSKEVENALESREVLKLKLKPEQKEIFKGALKERWNDPKITYLKEIEKIFTKELTIREKISINSILEDQIRGMENRDSDQKHILASAKQISAIIGEGQYLDNVISTIFINLRLKIKKNLSPELNNITEKTRTGEEESFSRDRGEKAEKEDHLSIKKEGFEYFYEEDKFLNVNVRNRSGGNAPLPLGYTSLDQQMVALLSGYDVPEKNLKTIREFLGFLEDRARKPAEESQMTHEQIKEYESEILEPARTSLLTLIGGDNLDEKDKAKFIKGLNDLLDSWAADQKITDQEIEETLQGFNFSSISDQDRKKIKDSFALMKEQIIKNEMVDIPKESFGGVIHYSKEMDPAHWVIYEAKMVEPTIDFILKLKSVKSQTADLKGELTKHIEKIIQKWLNK